MSSDIFSRETPSDGISDTDFVRQLVILINENIVDGALQDVFGNSLQMLEKRFFDLRVL